MAGKPSLSPLNRCPLTAPPEKPSLHMPGARRQGISTAFATRPEGTLSGHSLSRIVKISARITPKNKGIADRSRSGRMLSQGQVAERTQLRSDFLGHLLRYLRRHAAVMIPDAFASVCGSTGGVVPAGGVWGGGVARPPQDQFGRSTRSMRWITPFEAMMSAWVTRALFTRTPLVPLTATVWP
jgi:hypothetical protein